MPVQFQDISPYDFEDFMAELFREDGYDVEQTGYSGDFGADLLLRKSGMTTAVQIKRYAPDVKVSVPDINQVIAARAYYNTDDALIITTSDFTPSTIQLAKSAEVYLWNWDRLTQYISDVYFEGESFYAFFRDDLLPGGSEESPLRVRVRKVDNESSDTQIQAVLELENLTGKNLMLHVDLPILVTRKQKQITASGWLDGYYQGGLLLNESKTDVGCTFSKQHLEAIRKGDRFILRVFSPGFQQPVLTEARVVSLNPDCFIVTFCYGTGSRQYLMFINFRDDVLHASKHGRQLVAAYYKFSPELVSWCSKNMFRQKLSLLLFRPVIGFLSVLLEYCQAGRPEL